MMLEIAGGILLAFVAVRFWKFFVALAGWAIIGTAALAAYFALIA